MGEVVAEEGLGYAVDLDDPASLAAAIRDAVRRRDEWSDPARLPEATRARHTFDYYVPSLTRLYREALEERIGAAETAERALS
jgi:hypothetical protein